MIRIATLITRYGRPAQRATQRDRPRAAIIPAHQSEYSIWSDPHFWALCELLADICLEQTPQLNAPSGAPSRSATSERA